MGSLGDAASAAKWGAIAVVLYLVIRSLEKIGGPLGDQLDALMQWLDKRVTDAQELQEMIDRIENTGEKYREDFDQVTQDLVEETKERTSSLQEEKEKIQGLIDDAQEKINSIDQNIADVQATIDEKEKSAQEACNFDPELGWDNLLGIPGIIGGEIGERYADNWSDTCKELHSQLTIHKKTLEELRKARSTWEQRIDDLQAELDRIENEIQAQEGGSTDSGSTDDGSSSGTVDQEKQVLVQYSQSGDAEAANLIADTLASNSGVSATARNQAGVTPSNWDGIVVVGGPNANDAFAYYYDNGYIEGVLSTVTNITDLFSYSGTPHAAIAGATASDTETAAENFLFFSGLQSEFLSRMGV